MAILLPRTIDSLPPNLTYVGSYNSLSVSKLLRITPALTYGETYSITSTDPHVIADEGIEEFRYAYAWDSGALRVLELPSTLKLCDIGQKAENLELVVSRNPVPPEATEFADKAYLNATLSVPAESIEAYRNAPIWCKFKNIQSSVASVAADGIVVRAVEGGVEVTGAEASAALTVCDMAGRVIYHGASRHITGLAPGVYVVK